MIKNKVAIHTDPRLRKHQVEAVKLMRKHTSYALWWEMRVGKTPPTLGHLNYLLESGLARKIVILTTPSALPDWHEEFIKWSPQHLDLLYSGTYKAFENWRNASKGILLLSYSTVRHIPAIRRNMAHLQEAMSDKKSIIAPKFIDKHPLDCLILDESHNCKNYSAQRTRCCLDLSYVAKYKYLLSGTPTGGKDDEMFYQMKILDPNIFGTSKELFRQEYFYEYKRRGGANYPGSFFLRPEMKNEFHDKIKEISSSLRLKDLPGGEIEIERIPIKLPVSTTQKMMIRQLKKDYITKYENKEITAVNAAAELMKVLQILNGHCITESGDTTVLKENPKITWLIENLPQIVQRQKAIIWVLFKEDRLQIVNLLRKLKIGFVNYKSGSTTAQRTKYLTAFRKSEKARVFIAHQQSAGTGVNLSVAPVNIVYSRNHHWLAYQQAMSRNLSVGISKRFIYEIMIEKELDEEVKNRLDEKGKISDEAMSIRLMKSFLKDAA